MKNNNVRSSDAGIVHPGSREIRKHMSHVRHARHWPVLQPVLLCPAETFTSRSTVKPDGYSSPRFSAFFGERLSATRVKRPATLRDKINSFARIGGSAYRIRLIRCLGGVRDLIDSIERSICAIYLKIEAK